MRRLLVPALCGSLMLLLPGASLTAAPKKRARPAPRAAAARGVSPTPAEAGAAEPTSAPARRLAPRPRHYTLAEPSPEIQLKVKRIRKGGDALMISGYALSGIGLAGTIVGAVLIGIADGPKMQTGGTISLITGAATLALGATLWAIGRWRSNKADLLIIKARLRQVQLQDPNRQRDRRAHGLAPPQSQTVFSAQLRF